MHPQYISPRTMAFAYRRSFRVSLCITILVATTIGCGGGPGSLYPVKGKVSVQGKPVPRGLVCFSTSDAKFAKHSIVGRIDNDGTFTIKTDSQDGAPAGTYKVTITDVGPAGVGADPEKMAAGNPLMVKQDYVWFNRKYFDLATTDLTVTVSDSSAEGAYNLQLFQ